MAWDKIWLVLRREYLYNFRRPSYLFTALGVPAISILAMYLVFQLAVDQETNLDDWQRVAYLDGAGVVQPDTPNPDGYRPLNSVIPAADASPDPDDLAAWENAGRDLVRRDDLDALIVIPEHYVLSGQVDLYTDRGIPDALRENIEWFMSQQILARAPGDLAVSTDRLTDQAITLRDVETGAAISEAEMVGRVLLPIVFVIIYVMATNTTAQFMMSGVVEEKENRLMEILATSLRPHELLWGKLLGLAALALTQVTLWGIGAGVIANLNGTAQEFLTSVSFSTGDILLVGGLFVISFFLFAATMLAIGASVTAESESRQVAGMFSFVAVMPLVLAAMYMTNPDGPIPVALTFFPYTAGTSLIMRLGLTTIPAWQIALSIAIQVVSVFVVMWLAAKVFRLGMLMYGKRLTPRAVWAALREGRQVMTTASTTYDSADEARKPKQKRGFLGR